MFASYEERWLRDCNSSGWNSALPLFVGGSGSMP